MQARCRGAFLLILAPLLFHAAGCSRNKSDLIEAELRDRTQLYREALEDQRRADARILSLQREVEALRQGAKVTPDQAAQTFGLQRIVLGRSTVGLDNDSLPGDELLQVVVEPRDESDHSIKAPGTLQIFVVEISPQGIKTQLSQWDIPPEKLRDSWKQGLLSTGYTLRLPWKTPPATEKIRVVVRLITSDQRVYEADKDIKVRLMPGASRPRPQVAPEVPPMPYPAPEAQAAPILMPTSRVVPVPHVTQWRPVAETGGVTVGRPEPIDGPSR
ncbi:MAG: hypothetical protein HYX68_05160 [Planctomycetes bacterium]|nr:hypothetical protein [Planctomycetota bacterium]